MLVVMKDSEGFFAVVNTFDGVIVEEFLDQWDAEDFARAEEENERARCHAQYPEFQESQVTPRG